MPNPGVLLDPMASVGCPGGDRGRSGGSGAGSPDQHPIPQVKELDSYLESIGKTANDKKPRGWEESQSRYRRYRSGREKGGPGECFKGYIPGHARGRGGIDYYIRTIVLCEKEWCSTCGADGSRWHNGKIARWLPRVMAMGQKGDLGFLVITIPKFLRDKFKTPKSLGDVRRYWVEKMKREGFHRGFSKWHRGGEKNPRVYHPHLNLLFEARKYPEGTRDLRRKNRVLPAGQMLLEDLEAWREDWRRWLEWYTGEKVPVVSLKYQFKRTHGQKMHTLKYITKATLTWYDQELAELHNGMKTGSPWGSAKQWTDAKEWADTETCLKNDELADQLAGKSKGCHVKTWEFYAAEAISRRILPVLENGKRVHRRIFWDKFQSALGPEAGVHAAIGPELAGTGIFVDVRTYKAIRAFYENTS